MEPADIQNTEEIERIFVEKGIDCDSMDSVIAYRDWCRDDDSTNPSLFISDAVQSKQEYQLLNSKLQDSVIILIGADDEIVSEQNGHDNLLKKFNNFADVLSYVKDKAFFSSKFTEKVRGGGEKKVPTVSKDVVKKEEKNQLVPKVEQPIQSTESFNLEKSAAPSLPKQAPPSTIRKEQVIPVESARIAPVSSKGVEKVEKGEKVPPAPEKVNKTMTEAVERMKENSIEEAPPHFPMEEDEELQERLKSITEVAKKTPPVQTKQPIVEQVVSKEEEPKKETGQPILYEENPYHKRSRHLQKQVFAKQRWENHRTIGVWSPLHRMGVTSFTINFALFLAENRIYTSVLEGLTEQHALKNWLQRYSNTPTNWSSYAKAIHSDGHTNEAEWMYRNVMFLPLDTADSQFEWNALSLESYMTATNIIDITLVDFPTGKMTPYTEDSLHYINELWVLVDDATQETLAWKKYIHDMRKKADIPIYLLFNKTYEFSQVDRLSKELEIPLLTKLPALHQETMRNYYESIPLYEKKEVQEKILTPFSDLAKHLLGEDFVCNVKIPTTPKAKWTDKILKRLKPI